MSVVNEFNRLGMAMQEGFGVFVIDYAAYFPYSNQKDLILEASLSTKLCNNGHILNLRNMCILNNRYPNKDYLCMTCKHGRKLCKIGCIVQFPYAALNIYKYLNIGYGFASQGIVRISIPININLSDEKPCAGFNVHFGLTDPNNPEFTIIVYEKTSEMGWRPYTYDISIESRISTVNVERYGQDRFILLTPANTLEEAKEQNWIVYNETINLLPSKMEDLMI